MSNGAIILFAAMALFFIVRMPISYSMLSACILYYIVEAPNALGNVFTVITGNTYAGFTMLAAPLFVFMANVMGEGEIADRIYGFAHGLLGKMRGGSAQVNCLVSLIFSGMTGSAIADASGTGTMEIRQMIDEGYDAEFSCALSAATATVGPIFPPSIPMIIYAMLSGASVGKLFAGGMVPGVVLTVLFMIYSYILSQKRQYPMGQAQTFKQFVKNTVIALPALFTVVLLLGGIYSGVCTPTEAGALASAYAIVIGFLVYRSLSWKVLWQVLKQTARDTATLALLTGTAYLFSFIVSREKIPAIVSEFVLNFTHNKYMFLFIVNVVFLALGCVLDVSCIQLVFVPMVLPMVREFGIDLVHFGVMICFNMMIGLSTPPFGMLLFIVTKAGNTKIGGVIREILPMVLIMIAFLFLMTYIPEIIMFIPNMMTT